MPRGAKVGNCNAAKNKARCRAQKGGQLKSDINILGRGMPSFARRSIQKNRKSLLAYDEAHRRTMRRIGSVSKHYKFVHNLVNAIKTQNFMRGL